MINNSESVNLDLTAKDNGGITGFQLAQPMRRSDVVKLIKSKIPYLVEIVFWETLTNSATTLKLYKWCKNAF